MKKPVVDYRQFRLSKLNDPQFAHLKLLLGWVVYFLFYFLTENFIPVENCHVIHSALDDRIPFNEFFFIPYCFWYLLIVISLGYFALYDVENFRNLQTFIIITQVVAMTVYILYPSVQNLRPTEFARDNFFTWLAGIIYTLDTPTGVCPSLHVAYSLGIGSCWLKEKSASKLWKGFVVFSVILISLSTAVVKQHSV
ncbi:MAG: phosphatidic acid phosphatase, partial [Candidatus Faecousia sp.]|nr:phosphatidic acid phosphatase [Candidatus Faecousia sp.]